LREREVFPFFPGENQLGRLRAEPVDVPVGERPSMFSDSAQGGCRIAPNISVGNDEGVCVAGFDSSEYCFSSGEVLVWVTGSEDDRPVWELGFIFRHDPAEGFLAFRATITPRDNHCDILHGLILEVEVFMIGF
jgi:hypothetical protein